MGQNIIFETQDGSHSLMSEQYQVSYHSKYGALQETKHVFIEAGLNEKSLHQKEIDILEIGFGTGLNAYVTFLETLERGLQISYTAVEAYPIAEELVQQLNYPQLMGDSVQDDVFQRFHAIPWEQPHTFSPQFQLVKEQKHFESLAYKAAFDLIYYDAFAPTAQPELWEEPILAKMYQALRPGGIWVSYCAKGAVKRALRAIGFEVQTLPGPPGKREMIRAIKS
ncbi:MAG: tRNA (5-methylaminomethyl-2-thiouridine)(34)-methyltransferase MnmD [Bacteroidota bacterium]